LTYTYDLAGRVAARGGTLFQSLLPAAVTSASYDLANRLTARTAAGVTASLTRSFHLRSTYRLDPIR
jgi:hypothetical protein